MEDQGQFTYVSCGSKISDCKMFSLELNLDLVINILRAHPIQNHDNGKNLAWVSGGYTSKQQPSSCLRRQPVTGLSCGPFRLLADLWW